MQRPDSTRVDAHSSVGASSAGDRCALLVTDVVDSTQLAETLGNTDAARLWTAHDRLARDLLPTFRGREIDKTDGLLLLFEDAAEAAGYAAAYHRALATLSIPLSARAGLHVGTVLLRENSAADVARGAKRIEVDGVAKATAARIMSIANPGQTLVSAEARSVLGSAGWTVQSHGHWRLKGLAEPIELFEAHVGSSPCVPPVDNPKAYRVVRDGDLWLPVLQIRHSLPAERDPFIGRHGALDALARQFEGGARLVNLTGIGGTGKTRLATRFAWTWLGEFPGGAWFCDLSQARSIDGIAFAVSQALDVPLGKDDPIIQLGNAIAGRGRSLIVFDNFEQVSQHAEATLGQWLGRAREACFLVTSRGVLGLPGEAVLPLPPLAPDEAAALFVQRAQFAKRDFEVEGADAAAIGPLVKLLDGLPLAIELAAARVRVMPPRMLLARMSERFKLLATTAGRAARQATLRATFDWSWDLLSQPEKAAISQLSVFQGGFSLEAAEAVLDLAVVDDPPWPLDVLQSLVEKSLIRQVADDRFDLLVSVQDYAGEHLRTAGRYEGSGPVAAKAAKGRHSAYFAGLSERQAIAHGCIELENLVRACRRASARGDAIAATRALENAWAALQLRGPFKAGVDLASQVEAIPDLPMHLLARVNRVAGRALQALGRVAEARVRFDVAVAQARQVGDRLVEGLVESHRGDLEANVANADAAENHLTLALAIAHELADRSLECAVLSGLGTLNDYRGRIDAARRNYEQALTMARAIGDRRWEGGVLGNLGNLDASQGRVTDARGHYEAGLIVARELGNRSWEGNALCNLGLMHQVEGQLTEASTTLHAALGVARDLGHARLEAIVLCNLGIVHGELGETLTAKAHYQEALVLTRELGDRRLEGQLHGYLGTLLGRARQVDDARKHLERGSALLRELSDAHDLGVLLCGRAETEYLAGDRGAASAALDEAATIAHAASVTRGSELGLALDRATELLRGTQSDRPAATTAASG